MLRPTSPGRSCAAANTITLSTTSVISARPKRLSRNRPISEVCGAAPRCRTKAATARRPAPWCVLPQRRLAQVDLAEGVGLVALDSLRARSEVVVEVREDHRRVVEQDR